MLNGRTRHEQTRRAEGTSATMNDAGSEERDARSVDSAVPSVGRSVACSPRRHHLVRKDGRTDRGWWTDSDTGEVRGRRYKIGQANVLTSLRISVVRKMVKLVCYELGMCSHHSHHMRCSTIGEACLLLNKKVGRYVDELGGRKCRRSSSGGNTISFKEKEEERNCCRH